MRADNHDIDELKKAWTVMGERLGMLNPESKTKDLEHKKTALDRLKARYFRFAILGAFLGIYAFILFPKVFLPDEGKGIYLAIGYGLYAVIASLMDLWLWNGVGSIDPLTMSVSEVSKKALFYRKRHLQSIAVLVPMAIVLIVFTAYAFAADTSSLVGIAVGAIVGLVIGSIQLHKFMSEYRKLCQ